MRVRLVAVVLLALFLAACNEQTITTTPAEDGPTTTGVAVGGDKMAAVGDAIELSGSDDALRISATVEDVQDPAKAPKFLGPGKGDRYVAVEFRLENIGTAVYSDSPSNGAVVIDTEDYEYSATFAGLDHELGSPKIPPGDARVGLIVFEVPESADLRTFQFTLDSGFGPETGQWEL